MATEKDDLKYSAGKCWTKKAKSWKLLLVITTTTTTILLLLLLLLLHFSEGPTNKTSMTWTNTVE